MWFARIQRRLRDERRRVTSRLLSAAGTYSGLPLVVSAHGVHADDAPPTFPRRNFTSVSSLRDSIAWLRSRGYEFVSFADLARYLRNEAELPPRSAHLMFDDGYRSLHDCALPLLLDLKVPFSVALVENFVRGSRLLWTDELHCRIAAHHDRISAVNRIAPGILTVVRFDEAECRIRYHVNKLKHIPNSERIAFMAALANECPMDLNTVDPALLPLTASQITTLAQTGVAFLNHTRTHPVLSTVESTDQLRDELTNWDPALLERGFAVLPFGTGSEVCETVASALENRGVEFAFTMLPGLLDRRSPRFGLNRISLQRGAAQLAAELSTIDFEHARSLKRREVA
jgi:peptidoglycan/xylan/chitin deacetylase (PgdA/CDA1 family)